MELNDALEASGTPDREDGFEDLRRKMSEAEAGWVTSQQ